MARSPSLHSQASLAPSVVASLTRQLRALHASPPEGVRFLATESGTLTELHAEIVGPGALRAMQRVVRATCFAISSCAGRLRYVA